MTRALLSLVVVLACLMPACSRTGSTPPATAVTTEHIAFNAAAAALSYCDGAVATEYRATSKATIVDLVHQGHQGDELMALYQVRMAPLDAKVARVERALAALQIFRTWLDKGQPPANRAEALQAAREGLTVLHELVDELKADKVAVPALVTQGLDALGALMTLAGGAS